MAVLVILVLFLAFTGHSNANYCMCKDGLSTQILQKAIDYACGAGADCNPILTNGACFQPNTVKDHCNYAVNSYFQRKGQVSGSCDFGGAATPTVSLTASASNGCNYPSSPSNAGTTSPTTGGGNGGMGTNTPSTMTPSTMTPGVFGNGISPAGSGTGFNDGSGGVSLRESVNLLFTVALTLGFTLVLVWGLGP